MKELIDFLNLCTHSKVIDCWLLDWVPVLSEDPLIVWICITRDVANVVHDTSANVPFLLICQAIISQTLSAATFQRSNLGHVAVINNT